MLIDGNHQLFPNAESEEYLIIRQLQVRGTKIGPKNRTL